MQPVNSYDQVIQLEKQKQLVAVFVASGLDTEAIKWVFDTWFELDERSADRWHVVVPLRQMPKHRDDATALVQANFNTKLAKEIREVYGVEDNDTPALVFDDFNDEAHQLRISLSDKDERKKIILAISEFMNRAVPEDKRLTDQERTMMNAQLVNYLQMQQIKKTAFGFAKNVGSALFKIAFQKAFRATAHSYGLPL